MPSFKCQVCGTAFDVAQAALDKYPSWQPKYCLDHSPRKRKAPARGGKRRSRGGAGAVREENLTPQQVLERYHDGPDDGVFTDGSSVPNPGPGGWGVVWVENGEIREERHGHAPRTTNNRMELTALIEAFGLLPEDSTATVYTDSRLCVDTVESWAAGWEKRGWKRKGGEIKNLDLVRPLYELRKTRPRAKLQWIAAHSGMRWNEYADSLATAWMRPADGAAHEDA